MRTLSSTVRAFLVITFFCSAAVVTGARILGVQSKNIAYYEAAKASGSFTCLDGSAKVPFSMVNNELCDCADGSDEPGTSACAALRNGVVFQLPTEWQFQCTNDGFFAQAFPHHRVNDGICDCCDGSDEFDSPISCPNRCVEEKQELAKKAEAEQERMRQAAGNKAQMRANALKKRDDAAKALKEQEAERDKIQKELPSQEAKKAAADAAQEAKRAVLKIEWDKWEAERETWAAEKDANEEDNLCVQWRQTGGCKPDGPRENGFDKACSVVIPSTVSGFCECLREEAAEVEENAEGEAAGETDADTADETVNHSFSCGHPELTCAYVCSHNGEAGVDKKKLAPQNPATFTTEEARAASDLVNDQKRRLGELYTAIDATQKLLSSPTVTTEELLRTLEGQEFTVPHQQFTFAIRMFDKVYQRDDGQTHGGTLLGSWKAFADNTYAMWAKDSYDLSHMIYDNGVRCWNGVTRNTEVRVVCGPENKLTLAEEPSMCNYRLTFETPAMCDE